MALFWLFYRSAEKSAGVAIVEASWLVDARMRAMQDGLESGVRFSNGYALNPQLSAMIVPGEVSRFLSLDEASQIISRFETGDGATAPVASTS